MQQTYVEYYLQPCIQRSISSQTDLQDYDPAKLQEEAIAAARKIKADVASVDVYINVAESAAYYTIDGEGSSDYRIDL